MKENFPQNAMNEETAGNAEKDPGLKTEITTETTETLTSLIESIQDGEGIDTADITKLQEALEEVSVPVGPFTFPARRLLGLSKEEIAEQVQILNEIAGGNTENISRLKIINEQVRSHLEDVKYLYLNSLTTAEGLVIPGGVKILSLNSLPEAEKQKIRERQPEVADKIR